jgi:hypothetical protein
LKTTVFPISAAAVACLFMAASCRPLTKGPGEPSSRLSDLKGALTAGNREAAVANRIQTKTVDGITVSACLLPDEEARQRYGVNLAKKGLQAVWLRVANKTPDENWLLTAHLDSDYFTADEAAYLFRHHWVDKALGATPQHFRDLAMRSRLAKLTKATS